MERYKKIAEDVENGFIEPTYIKQEIRYALDEESADICVNAKHSLGDYLVLGIIALENSIVGKSGYISVYNTSSPKIETIGIAQNLHSPLRKVQVDAGTYIQLHKPLEVIYQKLYNGKYKMMGTGLAITTALMMQDAGLEGNIPEEIMSKIVFTSFDDLETAQKNAFFLIKKMVAASTAGAYYAMENGEDEEESI